MENEGSYEIILSQNVVDIESLNQVLARLKGWGMLKIHESLVQISLNFEKPINRINIIFTAGLFLCYKSFNIQFLNNSIPWDNEKYEWEFFSYRHQIHYLGQGDEWLSGYKEGNQVVSQSFAPILFIDENTINEIFRKTTSDSPLSKLAESYRGKLGQGFIKNEFGKQYLSQTENRIIRDLADKGPIHSFLFLLLFERIRPMEGFSRGYRKGKEIASKVLTEFENKLTEIERFTSDYVAGLYELAKNIVQHSTTRQGVITIRAYSSPTGSGISNNQERMLETHVFDYGENGILKTLEAAIHKSHDSETDKPIKTLYETDLKTLRDPEYRFKDFVEPSEGKILTQQLRRQMAHLGLLHFFQLIESKKGSAQASTLDSINSNDTYSTDDSINAKETTVQWGSSYFFTFPISSLKTDQGRKRMQRPTDGNYASASSSAINLLEFQINPSEKNTPKSIFTISFDSDVTINSREDEYRIIQKVKEQQVSLEQESFIAIDFEKINITPTSLYRILACISDDTPSPFIIYNIPYPDIEVVFAINKMQYDKSRLAYNSGRDNFTYWFIDRAILIYSYHNIADSRYYFADMLYGRTYDDFIRANKIISNTFPNATIINQEEDSDKETQKISESNSIENDSTLIRYFQDGSLLKPFDIILSHSVGGKVNREQLFLANLKYVLNKEILIRKSFQPQSSKIQQYLDDIEGYMIKDTHFRIGAKYHAESFIYAKRLFQNSYYASRIAFMAAQDIEKNVFHGEDFSYTLVGYEVYSELLLCLTENYLKSLGHSNIQHFFIRDTPKGLEIDYRSMQASILKATIIVPIVSTGSTTQKIKKYLCSREEGNIKEVDIHSIQILSVVDPEKYTPNAQDAFLTINTKWHDPSGCELCFKDGFMKPFLMADKTDLVPLQIFDMPAIKEQNEDMSRRKLNEKMFENSFIYMGKNPYYQFRIYSVDAHEFIRDNKGAIEIWLTELRKKFELGPSDLIVIISQSLPQNIPFVTLVNEKFANSSATIIYQQSEEDFLENFRIFNKSFLGNKTRKYRLFYVDTAIVTGNTFFKLYNALQYASGYSTKFDGVITLFNYSSADMDKRVRYATENNQSYDSFTVINYPILQRDTIRSEIQSEIDRYEHLSSECLFDRFRKNFLDKKERLEPTSSNTNLENKLEVIANSIRLDNSNKTNNSKSSAIEVAHKRRHIQMFIIVHYLYKIINESYEKNLPKSIDELTFDDLYNECIKYVNESDFKNKEGHSTHTNNIRANRAGKQTDLFSQEPASSPEPELIMRIMKVLCHYPFTLYLPLNNKIFEWLDQQIEQCVIKVNAVNGKDIDNNIINTFKFYQRRAVLLRNNRIVSTVYFEAIYKILLSKQIQDDKEQYSEEQKGLIFYFVRNYIEVIYKNPWCAKQIKDNLSIVNIKSGSEMVAWKRFKRMLSDECFVVVNDLYDLLTTGSDYKKNFEDKLQESSNGKLASEKILEFRTDFVESDIDQWDNLQNANKYILAKEFININQSVQDPIDSSFNYFAWIRYVVRNLFTNSKFQENSKNGDSNRSQTPEIGVWEETKILFDSIRGMLDVKSMGAFLVVKNVYNKDQIVYDQDQSGCTLLNLDYLECFHELFYKDYSSEDIKTSQIYKKRDDKWLDGYGRITPMSIPRCFSEEDYLIIMRIGSVKDKDTAGLLGIYWRNSDKEKNELEIVRFRQYLLLLRNDLYSFIKFHHQNQEYAQLQILAAQKKYTALFSHGQLMIDNLAENDDKEMTFRTIKSTLSVLQYSTLVSNDDSSGPNNGFLEMLKAQLPSTKIDIDNLAKSIVTMAEKIYKSEEVEESVEPRDEQYEGQEPSNGGEDSKEWKDCIIIKKEFNTDNSLFEFNENIIKYIFFELIVNAKKNRFIVLEGTGVNTSFCNDITIIIKNTSSEFKFGIKASSTKFEEGIRSKIENGRNPKDNDEVSGLNLINKVTRLFPPENTNKISIKSEMRSDNKYIYDNTIEVCLTKS